MPTLKVQLDEETHRRFKVWCASGGTTMQVMAVSAIKNVMEGYTLPLVCPDRPRTDPPVFSKETVTKEGAS